MKPFTVSVTVDRPREEVFAFLDVLGNHEAFTDHLLADWTLSGPASGVGARAHVRARTPGPADWIDITVLESEAPERIVETTVGAKGRRVTRGTYTLEPTEAGGTDVHFELVAESMPAIERPLAPLTAVWIRRANAKAMERLGALLAARGASSPQPAPPARAAS